MSAGGSITITGTASGHGTGSSNDGVILQGSTALVTTVNGALSISGSSGSTFSGGNNVGVYLYGGASVTATGTGAITITGTGGQASGNNQIGVLVTGTGSNVTGSSGAITLHGTGSGTGSGNYGVAVEIAGLIQDTSTGTVSLVGQAVSGTAGVYFDTDHGSKLKVATGNVVLTGDIITLGDANSIASSVNSRVSHLAFQSYTVGRSIVLGGASNVANTLTFTTSDLAAIAQTTEYDGFGLITIGSSGNVNPMSIGMAITFQTNLSLQAQGGLTLKIPNYPYPTGSSVMLVVMGTLKLNSDPLHLTAPSTAAKDGALITMIHTTEGLGGSTFLAQPQGSTVTDSAGHRYYISYKGNGGTDVVLTATSATPPKPASPGAGSGRGRG